MRLLAPLCILLLVLPLSAQGSSRADAAHAPEEILIATAASLAPFCEAMGRQFEAQTPGVRVRFTFASSGHLRQQIEAGAPVDGFISASLRHMEILESKGLIRPSTRLTLAQNKLVLVIPTKEASSVKTFSDLADPEVTAVALGDPSHVPAGYYGRAVLESLDIWERVKPKLVYGLNVRQVLQYVAQGEVDAGIVYFSDVHASNSSVRTAAVAPKGSHPTILYPMAVLRETNHPQQTKAFFSFLLSISSQKALVEYGLIPALPGRSN